MSSALIDFEVVMAAARSGIPIRNVYFEIPNPNLGNKEKLQFLRWQVFLSKALHICLSDTEGQNHMDKILLQREDGSYCVNIHSVCVAILHATCQCTRKFNIHVIFILDIINAAIPAYMAGFPSGAYYVFCYFCVITINLIYFAVMLHILYAGVKEMERKNSIASILDKMIRLHDYNTKANIRLGAAADESVITSEIKTIQQLICENTEMIRLSNCETDSRGNCSQTTKHLLPPKSPYADIQEALFDTTEGVYPKNSSISDGSIEVEGSLLEDFHIPQVELVQYNSNFVTWMQCRKILHNFGHRYSVRLSSYVGALCKCICFLDNAW